MAYLVSIEAPKPDADGNLDGDVLVVDGVSTEEKARAKASADPRLRHEGWVISDVTVTMEAEADELLPEGYEVER